MFRAVRCTIVVLAVVAVIPSAVAQQQPDPDSPRYKGVVALEQFLAGDDAASIGEFVESRIAASVRQSMGDEALVEALTALRAAVANAEPRGARPAGPLGAQLIFDLEGGGEMSVGFELDEADPDRFVAIRAPGHEIG